MSEAKMDLQTEIQVIIQTYTDQLFESRGGVNRQTFRRLISDAVTEALALTPPSPAPVAAQEKNQGIKEEPSDSVRAARQMWPEDAFAFWKQEHQDVDCDGGLHCAFMAGIDYCEEFLLSKKPNEAVSPPVSKEVSQSESEYDSEASAEELADVAHIPDNKLRAELAIVNGVFERCAKLLDQYEGIEEGMTSLEPTDERLEAAIAMDLLKEEQIIGGPPPSPTIARDELRRGGQ